MFATAMRCCSILVIVAMAFVVPSASSATGSQPLKKDSTGILRLAVPDEVRPFYLSDLCSSRDAPSASSIEFGMHQCKHWQQRKRQ
jgi:hypothetical protein